MLVYCCRRKASQFIDLFNIWSWI